MDFYLAGNELADIRCKTCGKCLGHVLPYYRHLMTKLTQQVERDGSVSLVRRSNTEETIKETCHVLACETLGISLVCDKSTLMSTIVTPPAEFAENFASPLIFDFSGSSNATQRKYGQAAATFSSASTSTGVASSGSGTSSDLTAASSSRFIQDLRKDCETLSATYNGL